MTSIENLPDLEVRILRQFVTLLDALDYNGAAGRAADGRCSAALERQRIAAAIGALGLAMTRTRAAHESACRARLRAIRLNAVPEIAGRSDERIPVQTQVNPENLQPSDERMPVARKRGGQPGNRNAFKHGQRSAAVTGRRARLRAALGDAGSLAAAAARLAAARVERSGSGA